MSIEKFSPDQVAAHNTDEDIWMVINGKVYDITPFKDEHPGGEEVLSELAGADATIAFDDVGHSTDAVNMLDDYYKGELEGEFVSGSKPEAKTSGVSNSGGSSAINFLIPIVLVVAAVVYKLYLS
ncbi:hypothetical protein SARC_12976 [Sphaeroforma arctica JP610]|uniref:Cytochrome b5 heme-binding domain-containing protein n=1 Tax=Sphaeroforma arctica JP610 TaxID=667725 RepID=A0A0L0FCK8_9EUKA|nr:hypothetical protein SARC_12976 [Sphaeroforma arctica JP610]KNC74479.1 hypothetical protein SARC_12976 [Sphaeroforma arctica JP610]|eukprot:XP_014148381.1 hypothetical protein SARC_12976 [Sphaeroforma arctica JP610]